MDDTKTSVITETPTPTVYASQGGGRYHRTQDCRALASAQLIWDCDGPDDLPAIAPMNGGYATLPTTALAALGDGKTPCAVCFPGSGAALARSSCEEDFGHQPTVGFIDGYGLIDVCGRCEWFGIPDDLAPIRVVKWPCTTAVILGLAVREVARCPP